MACRRSWDTAALHASGVGVTWIAGPLRARREHVLWEQEQARLPETQPLAVLVGRERERLALAQDLSCARDSASRALATASCTESTCAAALRAWVPHGDPVVANSQLQDLVAEWRSARLRLLEAKNAYAQADTACRDLQARIRALADAFWAWAPGQEVDVDAIEGNAAGGAGAGGPAAVARQWRVLQGCPRDGCRGYVTSLHKCGLCDQRVCRHCHVGLPADATATEAHVCNPDEVATAQEMAAGTKPCPSCAAPIYRVSGCDQMWCSQCRTAFNWVTGKTTSGPIHNPHYFAYLRQQGDTTAADPGTTPEEGGLACATQAQLAHIAARSCLLGVFQVAQELQDRLLTTAPPPPNNAMLRVDLLLGVTSKDAFCAKVYLQERFWRRDVDRAHVAELFHRVVMDLTARLGARAITAHEAKMQAAALVEYVNKTWQDLATLHKVCFPRIEHGPRFMNFIGLVVTGTKPQGCADKQAKGAGAGGGGATAAGAAP
jgi:hypothetical protein